MAAHRGSQRSWSPAVGFSITSSSTNPALNVVSRRGSHLGWVRGPSTRAVEGLTARQPSHILLTLTVIRGETCQWKADNLGDVLGPSTKRFCRPPGGKDYRSRSSLEFAGVAGAAWKVIKLLDGKKSVLVGGHRCDHTDRRAPKRWPRSIARPWNSLLPERQIFPLHQLRHVPLPPPGLPGQAEGAGRRWALVRAKL